MLTYLISDLAANGLIYSLTILIAVVAFCLAHGTFFDIAGIRSTSRLTDYQANRLALSAMITGLAGFIALSGHDMPPALILTTMLAAWGAFYAGLELALGPCPHRVIIAGLIESRPPVGYRRLNLAFVRVGVPA